MDQDSEQSQLVCPGARNARGASHTRSRLERELPAGDAGGSRARPKLSAIQTTLLERMKRGKKKDKKKDGDSGCSTSRDTLRDTT